MKNYLLITALLATATLFSQAPLFANNDMETSLHSHLCMALAGTTQKQLQIDLYEALWRNETQEKIASLLALGADPHCTKWYDQSAVMYAILQAKDEAAIALLNNSIADNGNSLKTPDAQGWNILHFAAASKSDSLLIPLLLSKGIDITAQTDDGKTALDLAREYDHPEKVAILLAHTSRDRCPGA